MTPFPRAAYRPLEPYAPDRRPVPVDLSDNTNRWGTHPAALKAVRDADPEELLRYPPVYADRLKAAVARRFRVPVEAVATGCGSDDLLDSAFRAACEPGEGVRFMPPTFSMIEIFARMNGLVPLPLERAGPAGPESPFGPLPDPDQLLGGIAARSTAGTEEGRPGLVYLCRPNNPTGEVQPRRWVEALLDAGGPEGPVVLLDEAYADFMDPEPEPTGERSRGTAFRGGSSTDAGADPGPAGGLLVLAAGSDRLVVLRTLSKAYGLAGLRVGFAVGAPAVIREIEKSRGPYKVNRLAEAAAVAALADQEEWVPGILAPARRERTRLARELEARGLPPLPSGANFVCVPLTGTPLGDGRAPTTGIPATRTPTSRTTESPAARVTAALRERGVAVRPFPGLPGIGDAVRVSVGPRREMDAFLEALDGVLAAEVNP